MTQLLDQIREAIIDGDFGGMPEIVQNALDSGIAAESLLDDAMIPAMEEVGQLYEDGEFYVPEMLISAKAMNCGMELIRPRLKQDSLASRGKVLIGTSEGDLHDIGKNLVGMMLEGAGFEVINLGSDIAPERFVAAIKENEPQIIAMSSLLTTTMPAMKRTIDAITDAGLREKVSVMIGGAPVTQDFADRIGADGYSTDANSAVGLAKRLIAG